MANGERQDRTPVGWLVAYALPSGVSSVAALPIALFVPAFYAEELGVPLASVGLAIALSRLLDVVTDPLIGQLSDRSRSRFGRRKPFIVLGTPLFALGLWQLFVPGEQAGFAHLLGWSAALYLGLTLIDLPHKAWGAELATDYDERSRVTSYREAISTAGQVILLAALAAWAASGVSDSPAQLRAIAVLVVIAMPILVAVAVAVVPEPPREKWSESPVVGLAGLRLVARNPAFRRMVGCVLLFVSGIAIQGTLHRLVLSDVIGDASLFPVMILIENVATLAAVPIWLRSSQHREKHRVLAAAALWIAFFSLPLALIGPGDATTLIIVIAIRGSSFASILFIANSIAADVIDLDTVESGEQRSGLYFAVWGMVTKLALALGVLLGTTLPSAIGYAPSAETISASTKTGLMIIYGLVPAGMMGAGVLFLRGFPITRARHAAVRVELAARALPTEPAQG